MYPKLVPTPTAKAARKAARLAARRHRFAILTSFAVASTVTLGIIAAIAEAVPVRSGMVAAETRQEQLTPVVLPAVQIVAAQE
jgi:hypothetical protein